MEQIQFITKPILNYSKEESHFKYLETEMHTESLKLYCFKTILVKMFVMWINSESMAL